MKILLVSPNQSLQSKLYQILSSHRFIVELATDGEEAWGLLQAFVYDLVVLEAIVPKLDGLELCHRLRKVGNPILILLLIEKSKGKLCIEGLNSGADACLTKPVQESELLAHIHTLARRFVHRASSLLSWGPLSLNPTACSVTCHGQPLKLNRKEYQLLELFLSHPRQMFPRQEIGDRLWTLEEQLPTDATIKSHIRSIRRKLEQAGIQDMIQTHYGQGYCLNPAYDSVSKVSSQPLPNSELMMDSITAHIWQELMSANARLQQEIEQRREVESQLRRSETMLRNAQGIAQVGCWYVDIHTREIYWTEELFLIHGLVPSKHPPSLEEQLSLIHPDDRQIYEEAIRTPAIRREKFEANLRIIRADNGEVRYINARGGPIYDTEGKVIQLTGTTLDLTRWIGNQA